MLLCLTFALVGSFTRGHKLNYDLIGALKPTLNLQAYEFCTCKLFLLGTSLLTNILLNPIKF